jgi:ABC-2 type transport system ATP-binding protein
MLEANKRLEIRDLKKQTKTSLVMDEVNITVHAGEIFALVGDHHSCKTLISKIVLDLVRKSDGAVIIDGDSQQIGKTSVKIGAALAQQNFYGHLTPYKTLEQYAILHKAPISHPRIVNTLNLVGLRKQTHITIDRFDESAIARLRVAVAFYLHPKIMILDDPFKKLSKDQAHNIRVLIKTIADTKRVAVFIATREVADIEEICDTIGIIDDGYMVMVKSYNQFIRDDAPYETMRVMTQTPNYAAKVIEEELGLETDLCGEWVVINAKPEHAQSVADTLAGHEIKVLSMQRVNRSLQEQFYEIISRRRKRTGVRGAS